MLPHTSHPTAPAPPTALAVSKIYITLSAPPAYGVDTGPKGKLCFNNIANEHDIENVKKTKNERNFLCTCDFSIFVTFMLKKGKGKKMIYRHV